MDIQIMVTTAVALLTPYVVKMGERVAEKAGEEVFDKAKELYEKISNKFKGDNRAEKSLNKFAKSPKDKNAIATLYSNLEYFLEDDESFKEVVYSIIKQAEQTPQGQQIIQTINQTLENPGSVGGSIIQAGNIEGDIN